MWDLVSSLGEIGRGALSEWKLESNDDLSPKALRIIVLSSEA